MDSRKDLVILVLMHQVIFRVSLFALIVIIILQNLQNVNGRRPRRRGIRYSLIRRIPHQIRYMDRLLNTGDTNIKDHLRMNRDCFGKLCYLLHNVGGLCETKYVGLSEQVSMFLDVLSHHTKNRKLRSHFIRSGETVSKCFNRVLLALLKLHPILLSKPDPVTADDLDYTWQSFQGCLGALDGTYVDVQVRLTEKPRYRTRKGLISTNVLCVCDRSGLFVYVLAGWEGSASDSRVLKDAITRPNGFKVPTGCYYLADGGYTNGEGFLIPYRGERYHLKDWGVGTNIPQNYKEYFNMKHCRARNVIERSFGALKKRWAILQKNSYFPIKTQSQIIMACVLLHNFIRREDTNAHLDEEWPSEDDDGSNGLHREPGYIDVVEPSDAWAAFRDNMAHKMFNEWQTTRRRRRV